MISFRSLCAKLAPAAVVAGLVMGAADPAGATIVSSDRVKFSAQEVDFGRDWILGAPANAGFLYWHLDNGVVSPRLSGNLYLNNASGRCARMQMQFFDGNTRLSTNNGGTVCASNGSLHRWSVNLQPFAHRNTDKVKVYMQLQNTNGSWSNVASTTQYL